MLRPTSPEDYHSAQEPSEADYESKESERSGTDSAGYSSTMTTTSHHNTDHTQHSSPRIKIENARTGNIVTGRRDVRPMQKNNGTGGMAG